MPCYVFEWHAQAREVFERLKERGERVVMEGAYGVTTDAPREVVDQVAADAGTIVVEVLP